MKKKLITSLLFILTFNVFSEIVAWKGQEHNLSPTPDWLREYIEKENEKKLRKKFHVEKNYLIFYSQMTDLYLENARYAAQIACQNQIRNYLVKKNPQKKIQGVKGLEEITEFWTKSSDGIYTVYIFYQLPAAGV